MIIKVVLCQWDVILGEVFSRIIILCVFGRYGFVLRIVLLLVLAWMTLLLFNAVVIVVPVSIGRALFNAMPRLPITHGIKCNGMHDNSMN